MCTWITLKSRGIFLWPTGPVAMATRPHGILSPRWDNQGMTQHHHTHTWAGIVNSQTQWPGNCSKTENTCRITHLPAVTNPQSCKRGMHSFLIYKEVLKLVYLGCSGLKPFVSLVAADGACNQCMEFIHYNKSNKPTKWMFATKKNTQTHTFSHIYWYLGVIWHRCGNK